MKLKDKAVPVTKNEEIEMSFSDLSDKGEGIGRYKGFTVMVPGALPGEFAVVRILQLRTHFAYGKLIRLLHRSPERIDPHCPLDGRCGGCQLGHLSYEGQLAYKRNKVKQDLTRIGHFSEEEIEEKLSPQTLGMEYHERMGEAYLHYRNKAQYPVQIVDGRAEAGFYAPRSHRLLPTEDCRIQSVMANELIHEIMQMVRETGLSVYDEKDCSGLLRHVLIRTSETTRQISVCFVINGKTIPHLDKWKEFMRLHEVTSFALNINTANTNV
ncbi:MAG: TRAM domain-containing protein, partial [Erysipelotrichaceae bacterium]|nr:TRAM domain-containing protein [Erysipelotrichaceae bacterium]